MNTVVADTEPVRVTIKRDGRLQAGVVMPHQHYPGDPTCPVRLDSGIWTAAIPSEWTVVPWTERT